MNTQQPDANTVSTDDLVVPRPTLNGGLIFRIRGGEHHGRVLRITRPSCSVGSAANCTLRLNGPGIQPMHCLILRGRTGTAVRRWSPDTRLNGHEFIDERLQPGDRLTLGSVELELIEEFSKPEAQVSRRIDPLPVPPAENLDENAWESTVESIASQLGIEHFDKRRPAQSLQHLHRVLDEKLAQSLTSHETQRVEIEQRMARQRERLDEETELLARHQRDLEDREDQLEQSREELADRWRGIQERERGSACDAEPHKSVDEERAKEFKQGIEQARQERDAALQELDAAKAQIESLGQQQAELDELRQAFEDRRDSLDDQQAGFDEAKAECERQAEQITEREAEWSDQLRESHDRCQVAEEELSRKAEQLQELQRDRQGLHERLENAEKARQEAEEALADIFQQLSEAQQSSPHETQLGELDEKLQRLQEENEALKELQRQTENETQQIRQEQRELAAQNAELRIEHEESLAKVSELKEQLASQAIHGEEESEWEYEDSAEAEPRESLQEEELAFSTPDDAPPVDTSEILRRYQAQSDSEEPSETASVDRRAATRDPAAEHADEDIGDYMKRLLGRVDGVSEPRPVTPHELEEETAEVEEEVTSEPKSSLKPEVLEYLPRIRPPEMDLSMMRDLANESARSAINQHSHKLWLQGAYIKWCVSLIALMTGGVLLYWTRDFVSIAGFGAMVAIVVAIFWALQGVWLARFALTSGVSKRASRQQSRKPRPKKRGRKLEDETPPQADDSNPAKIDPSAEPSSDETEPKEAADDNEKPHASDD